MATGSSSRLREANGENSFKTDIDRHKQKPSGPGREGAAAPRGCANEPSRAEPRLRGPHGNKSAPAPLVG